MLTALPFRPAGKRRGTFVSMSAAGNAGGDGEKVLILVQLVVLAVDAGMLDRIDSRGVLVGLSLTAERAVWC